MIVKLRVKIYKLCSFAKVDMMIKDVFQCVVLSVYYLGA